MTRYFYTNPLHVAVMAQDFGMKFDQFRVDHPDDMASPYYTPNKNGVFIGWTGQRKFYINQESLPLLKPQWGDVLNFMGDMDSIYDVCRLEPYGEKFIARPLNMNAAEHHFHKIIQRDGKPFYWPKCEE